MRLLKFCLLAAFCLAAAQNLFAVAAVTYISGPNFCSSGIGYSDLPYCTIPTEIPLGSFPVPTPGGTYLDPNFGGLVRILTATPYVHVYSQPSPVSAHNRYLGIRGKDSGRASILNFNTGHFDFDPLPFSDAWVWDAYSDDIHYRIEGARILKTVLSAGQETVLVDYSQTSERFTSISAGGGTDTSKDNWLGFYAPDQHQICTVNLNTVRTYCADYMSPEATAHIGWDSFDYVMVSKGVDSTNGKRYVLLMGNPAMGMWSVNLTTGKLDFETRGPDNYEWGSNQDTYCDPNESCLAAPHADVMEDAAGKQYLVTTKGIESPCSLQMVTMDLSRGRSMFSPDWAGGGLKAVLNLSSCGEDWPDFDLGCAKNAPYCVISTYRNSWRNPADRTSVFSSEPHRDQIAIMRGNGEDIKFLAATRTVTFLDDSYGPQPRAALSPDGQYVVFDSNFGVDGGERVAIVSTLPPANPVKAVSVAPSAVSASTQTLTLTYSDIAGASDLSFAWLWIKPAAGSPAANSCMILYDRPSGVIRLADDSGIGWLSLVPGAAGIVQNSQCSLNGAGVTVALTSNDLVLSVPLTFKPAYTGAKQVWITASGGKGSSGWQQLGSWTIPAPVVTNTSVTPAAGNGAGQTFTAVFNDTAGAADIASASLSITSSASGSGVAACSITWTRATGQFKLLDDAGAVSSAAQNSQCSLDTTAARAVAAGNTVTLTLPVALKPAFAGAKGLWMSAAGNLTSSQWQKLGAWTVNAPVVAVSASPASGQGSAQTFTLTYSDGAGASDLVSLWFWFTSNFNAAASNTCFGYYDRASDQFKLLNDAGNLWSGAPRGAAGALQNSQCAIDTGSAQLAANGNTLTISVAVTFTSAFAGARDLWMYGSGRSGASEWVKLATWTVPAAVVVPPAPPVDAVSVAPSSGAGSAQTFTLVFRDTAGTNDLVSAWFWITSSFNSAAVNSCFGYYDRIAGQFKLLSDAGNLWSSVMQNSQCSFDAGISANANGNTLTLVLPVHFGPGFTGPKEIWTFASGRNTSSDWKKLATWTVP